LTYTHTFINMFTAFSTHRTRFFSGYTHTHIWIKFYARLRTLHFYTRSICGTFVNTYIRHAIGLHLAHYRISLPLSGLRCGLVLEHLFACTHRCHTHHHHTPLVHALHAFCARAFAFACAFTFGLRSLHAFCRAWLFTRLHVYIFLRCASNKHFVVTIFCICTVTRCAIYRLVASPRTGCSVYRLPAVRRFPRSRLRIATVSFVAFCTPLISSQFWTLLYQFARLRSCVYVLPHTLRAYVFFFCAHRVCVHCVPVCCGLDALHLLHVCTRVIDLRCIYRGLRIRL